MRAMNCTKLQQFFIGAAALLALATGAGCGGDSSKPKVEGGTSSPGQDGSGSGVDVFAPAGGNNPVPLGDGAATPSGDTAVAPGPDAPTSDAPRTDGPATPGPDGPTLLPDAPPPNLCGNGMKDPGEACDPTSKDPSGRCPDICPPLACATRKMINAGTCQAQCVTDQQITACANGDGCCAPGCNANNDADCQPVCGNMVQESGETCDPLTACPESCPRERCEVKTLFNPKSCQAECRTTSTITACIHSDGCCPPGCINRDDNDCDPSCDNGVKEMDETCDPRTTCPTPATCKNMGCKRYTVKNPDTCKATCELTEIFSGCVNNDGCCSAGCNANNDSDCKPVCGNGVVEGDETCEPGSSKPCPAKCDPVVCAIMQLEGDDICHRRCAPSGMNVTKCEADGFGCCPGGCNANSSHPNYDPQCMPVCGNNVLEGTEKCDDPDCNTKSIECVSNADEIRMPEGLVVNCTFECKKAPRPCSTTTMENKSDGFCPSHCTAATDVDCKIPDGGNCDAGNAFQCEHKLCIDNRCCKSDCPSCYNCTGAGGTCVLLHDTLDSTPPATVPPEDLCNGSVAGRICWNGSCKALENQICTKTDGSQCRSGVCEAGKCRAFACHTADQDWTPMDECRTLNGHLCTDLRPCWDLRCDFESKKCVDVCGMGTTTAMSGLPDPTGTGVCKFVNDHTCSDGSQCAAGLCNLEAPMGACVTACPGGTIPVMDNPDSCRCPMGKVYFNGQCLFPLDGPCTTGSECTTGLCDVKTMKCTDSCKDDTEDVGMGKCDCGAGKTRNPVTNKCRKDSGTCTAGAECGSNLCNITDDLGNGQCIAPGMPAMCPAAKPVTDGDKCKCPASLNLHPVTGNPDTCECIANYEDLGAGCKKKNGQGCGAGSECSNGTCNELGICNPCGLDFMASGGGCVPKSCTINTDCPDSKQCNENNVCGPCGPTREVAGGKCRLKEGNPCAVDSDCSHDICNESHVCGPCGPDLMHSGGACVPKDCTMHSDCAGMTCNENGKCGSCGSNYEKVDPICKLKSMQPCMGPGECASGSCTMGACD